MCKVIGVISLKGGVGKTSSVVALGHAFASMGKKVLLIDGNLSAPNLGIHLNILHPEKTLHDVLQRKIESSEAVHNLDKFDLIPASLYNHSGTEKLALRKRIYPLKNKYDVILIDSSPRLDDETLSVMIASDELLVVTTPDLPTLEATIKSVKFAKQRGSKICGLILNKVYKKRFEMPLRDIESSSGVPVMAVIPHDINFLKSLSEFKSSVETKPNSEASREYKKLAYTMIGEKNNPLRIRTFLRWINPKRQDINRTIYYENFFK